MLRTRWQWLQSRAGPLLADPVTQGWAEVLAGTAGRLLLGFMAGVLLARALGPANYGILALLSAVGSILGLVIDGGLSETAVRRIAAAWPAQPAVALLAARRFFWLRLILAAVGLGLALMLAPVLLRLLQLGHAPGLLLLVVASSGTSVLNGVLNTLLQAVSRFRQLALVLVATSALTLLATGLLAAAGRLTLAAALLIQLLVSLPAAALGLSRLPPAWRRPGASPLAFPGGHVLGAGARLFFRFGAWLWLANILKVAAAHLDLFLVNLWLPPATLGSYALALNLASKAEIVNHSLITVLIPASAALQGATAVRRHLRHSLRRSGLIAVMLLLLAPPAAWLIPFIYGADFRPAVTPFLLLVGVAIFDMFALPLLLLVYALDRPRLAALSGLLQLAVLLPAGPWLIPSLGPPGAVAARFAARLVAAAVTGGLLWRHVRRLGAAGGTPSTSSS